MICLGIQIGKLSEEPCSWGMVIILAPAFFACLAERALNDVQVFYRQHANSKNFVKIHLVKIFNGKRCGRKWTGLNFSEIQSNLFCLLTVTHNYRINLNFRQES